MVFTIKRVEKDYFIFGCDSNERKVVAARENYEAAERCVRKLRAEINELKGKK